MLDQIWQKNLVSVRIQEIYYEILPFVLLYWNFLVGIWERGGLLMIYMERGGLAKKGRGWLILKFEGGLSPKIGILRDDVGQVISDPNAHYEVL